MAIDKKFLNLFTKATEKAAIGASKFIGKKDKIAADKGAVDPMRRELNKINMEGTIVIGEGEMDEAPMLFIGEKVGTKKGQKIDLAVDPLEGTNFAAKNLPGAISVLAISEKGNLFNAPETYMNKIAVGKDVPYDATDLDYPLKKIFPILQKLKIKILMNSQYVFSIDQDIKKSLTN